MWKRPWWRLILVRACAALLMAACGAPDGTDPIGDLEPAPETPRAQLERRGPVPAETPGGPIVAGTTAAGHLALFDGATGAFVDERSFAEPATGGAIRDLVWDGAGQRLLIYRAGPDGEDGAVATVAVVGLGSAAPRLGAVDHRAWVQGRVRLWPAHQGLLLFADGLGERWKLLRDDGVPTASVSAARPTSAWSLAATDEQRVMALGYGAPGARPTLQLTTARLSSRAIESLCVEPLGVAPTSTPPSARLLPWRMDRDQGAADGALVLDLAAGRLTLRPVEESGARPAIAVPIGNRSKRIEQALRLPPGPRSRHRRLALLLNGPGAVAIVELAPHEPRPTASSTLRLPGTVRRQDRYFGRDALALGPDRLLVGTDDGVVAVSLQGAGPTLRSTADDRFDGSGLRGPLAGPLQTPRRAQP